MPGVYGIIAKQPLPDANLRACGDIMRRMMLHQPWYHAETFTGDGVILGTVSVRDTHALQKVTCDGCEYTVAFDGYVCAVAGRNGRFRPAEQEGGRELAELVVSGFRSEGEQFPAKVMGNYVIAMYNARSGDLHIFNDRMGPRRLYIADLPEMFVFASEVKALSFLPGFPRALDWKGIADFLNYGYVLGDNTFFEAVKSPPSAMLLTFRRNGCELAIRKYWRPVYADQGGSIEALADRGYELLRESIGEKVAEGQRVISLISGGLDSRIILGALAGGGKKLALEPVTYGQKFSYEYKNARKVCQTLGLAGHRLVEITPAALLGKFRQAVWLCDGLTQMTNAHLLLLPAVLGVRQDVLLNGIYGGPTNYSAEYYREDHIDVNLESAAKVRDIQRVICLESELYERALSAWGRQALAAHAESSIAAELEKHLGASERFCDQRDAFLIENRMRRHICQSAIYRFFWNEKLPLSNYDLYDFYLAAPPAAKLHRRLLKAMLLRKLPELARIADANTGLNLFERPTAWLLKKRELAAKFKYYAARLTRGVLSFYNKQTYAQYDKWLLRDRATRRFYSECLLSGALREAGIIDERGMRGLFESVANGGVGFIHVSRIATFALWYELFVTERGVDEVRAHLAVER